MCTRRGMHSKILSVPNGNVESRRNIKYLKNTMGKLYFTEFN
jgi:hypothetical protein